MNTHGTSSHDVTPLGVQLARPSRAPGPEAQRPWEMPRAVALMLALLPMLRSRPPRRNRPPRKDWILPNGCAFAVRYRSR
jgi:hypothetical protein